jgi:hypothetical protein
MLPGQCIKRLPAAGWNGTTAGYGPSNCVLALA